jgi:hypothetical protein
MLDYITGVPSIPGLHILKDRFPVKIRHPHEKCPAGTGHTLLHISRDFSSTLMEEKTCQEMA